MATTRKKRPPAKTLEAREHQLTSLAIDLAEKQLIEGTASSQVVTHFISLGTVKHQLLLEKTRLENRLLEAKTDAVKAAERNYELYQEALAAMSEYKGGNSDAEDI